MKAPLGGPARQEGTLPAMGKNSQEVESTAFKRGSQGSQE